MAERSDETTVKITLKGVKAGRLDRLRTVVKTYIQTFARSVEINDGLKKPKRGSDAESEVREVPVEGSKKGIFGGSAR